MCMWVGVETSPTPRPQWRRHHQLGHDANVCHERKRRWNVGDLFEGGAVQEMEDRRPSSVGPAGAGAKPPTHASLRIWRIAWRSFRAPEVTPPRVTELRRARPGQTEDKHGRQATVRRIFATGRTCIQLGRRIEQCLELIRPQPRPRWVGPRQEHVFGRIAKRQLIGVVGERDDRPQPRKNG